MNVTQAGGEALHVDDWEARYKELVALVEKMPRSPERQRIALERDRAMVERNKRRKHV